MPSATRTSLPKSGFRSSWSFTRSATPMHIHRDLCEFVELLNSKAVEYVVVGAYAVAYHGYPRYTGDLDLLVRPSPETPAGCSRRYRNSAAAN